MTNTPVIESIVERQVGRALAIGCLRWEYLPEIHPDYRVEVKVAAARHEAKIGCLYEPKSGKMGVGLLPPDASREARSAYSAAVWLATVESRATLYIEQMPSGRWWILAIDDRGNLDKRTDVILPTSQAVELIDSILDEARGMQSPLRVLQGSPQVPLTNLLERAPREHLRLEELLTGAPPPEAKLAQIVGLTPAAYLAIAAAAVVAMAGVAGYSIMQRWRAEQALEQARRAAEAAQIENARLASMTQIRIAEAVTRALDEDTRTAAPRAVIAGCLDAFHTVGQDVAGWAVDNLECDINGASARVTLVGQRLAQRGRPAADNAALLGATRANGWQPQIDSEQARAVFTVSRPAPPLRAGLKLDALPIGTAVQEFVMPRFQRVAALGRGFSPQFHTPTERAITYADPAMDHDTSNPARFKPVPPERSYRVAKITISGDNAEILRNITLDEAIITLTSLRLQPQSRGQAKFVLEASYVLARS